MTLQPAHRISEFLDANRRFVFFDLSAIKSNVDMEAVIALARDVIVKYKRSSVYTITNIAHIAYDTETKEMLAEWMVFNAPYVVRGAILGADGLKRIMLNSVLSICGRANVRIFETEEQAMAWLSMP